MKTTPKKLSVGVLASGSGTDLQSIINASEKGMIDAEVVMVISNKKGAFALDRAKTHHIPGFFVDPKGKDRTAHEDEIDAVLRNHQVELVVGAGYMRLLSPTFVKKWHHKLINVDGMTHGEGPGDWDEPGEPDDAGAHTGRLVDGLGVTPRALSRAADTLP